MPSKDVLERARQVKLCIFDVDGVLTDGQLMYTEDGREMKAFYAQDGLGMKYLSRIDVTIALITGRDSPIVAQRAQELNIDHVYQGRDDKRDTYTHLVHALGLRNAQVAYVGDDLVDLPLLRQAGLAITVPNAHPAVVKHVHWTTPRAGGVGAVRDVCDLLLQAHGAFTTLLESLYS